MADPEGEEFHDLAGPILVSGTLAAGEFKPINA